MRIIGIHILVYHVVYSLHRTAPPARLFRVPLTRPRYSFRNLFHITSKALIALVVSRALSASLSDALNAYVQIGNPIPHVHLLKSPLGFALGARGAIREAQCARNLRRQGKRLC